MRQVILGNTRTKMTNQQGRKWALTLNNYTEDNYATLLHTFKDKNWNYIIGKEVGKENNTPHLQIFIESKTPIRFNTIKKINDKLHIEKARGSTEQNFIYCSKEGNYETNIIMEGIIKDPLQGKELYKYQKDILNIINNKPSGRKIHWFWEPDGNTGKTSFCKHICLTRKDAIYVSGKAADIKYAISDMKIKPKIILWDIPRSHMDYISYEAIESIKNGIFFNGKYESGMVIFNTPIIIIFSNGEPIKYKLSEDRWDIRKIII